MVTGEFSRLNMVDLTCCQCGKEFQRPQRLMGIRKHLFKSKNLEDSQKYYCSRDCFLGAGVFQNSPKRKQVDGANR